MKFLGGYVDKVLPLSLYPPLMITGWDRWVINGGHFSNPVLGHPQALRPIHTVSCACTSSLSPLWRLLFVNVSLPHDRIAADLGHHVAVLESSNRSRCSDC